MNPKCYGNCWSTCKCGSCDCQYDCEKETELPMILGKILPYLSMSCNVNIWLNGEIVSRYDGRDSIPVEHNDLLIEENGIDCKRNEIDIYCYEK